LNYRINPIVPTVHEARQAAIAAIGHAQTVMRDELADL
jgi:hypothetical protein